MKTIGQVKTTITQKLHGTTLNKIGDFYTICRDAAEIMLARIDPQETVRRALLTNAVYDRVYDYSLPDDFKAPSNLNKQSSQFNFENNSCLMRTFSRQFNNQKLNNQFAILWENTVQYLRFARYLNTPALIDSADSLTDNGNWAVGGNASALVLDTLNYIAGTGALKCTVSSPGAVQSVQLLIGSSSANYFTKSITAGHFSAFVDGWNLLRFDLSDATETGTVDKTDIKYVKATVTYNSGQTAYFEKTLDSGVDLSVNSGDYFSNGAIFLYMNFGTSSSLTTLRLDNITANIGTLFDLTYYSSYLFRNTSGTWLVVPTSDNDILNLSQVSYKIFEAEVCKIITQIVQGAMGGFDYNYWENVLEGEGQDSDKLGLYDQYQKQFPSERFDGETDYYNITDDFPGPNADSDEWTPEDFNN